MDYTLCQDDDRIVLQGITIKCNRCKRVMMFKKCTEGMIRKRAGKGVFCIWQIWDLLHRNKITTESEQTIKAYEAEQSITGKKKKAGKGAKPEVTDNTRNKEDFEAMKRKTKGILIGMIAAVVAAVAGVVAYKATH